MRTTAVSIALLLAASPSSADDKSDALMPVHKFVDNLDKGNMKAAAAAYAPMASIIDEFPPHHWQGAAAFADWGKDFGIDAKKHGDSDPSVTLAAPSHFSIEGDRAYAVFPATFSFKENGKPMTETGSSMTFALQKFAGGWRITGWSWAAH